MESSYGELQPASTDVEVETTDRKKVVVFVLGVLVCAMVRMNQTCQRKESPCQSRPLLVLI